MATTEQIAANRKNAKKSTGPKSPSGKATTKLNGLKHGLRAEQVVLPTEDPAEFRSFVDAWMSDWQPTTMARASSSRMPPSPPGERSACVRVEAARISMRVRQSHARWDRDELAGVNAVVVGLKHDPSAAVGELMGTRAGVERLIAMWNSLAEAASKDGGWSHAELHHARLFQLQGRQPGDADMGACFEISWRLLLANRTEDRREDEAFEPYTAEAAEAAAATIRRLALHEIDRLREVMPTRPDCSAARDEQAELDAFAPQPEDAPLLRYEGQLARQFHRSLAELVKLTKSGDDLAAPTEANSDPEVEADSGVEPDSPSDESAPKAAADMPREADRAVIRLERGHDNRPARPGTPAEALEMAATG